MKLLAPSVLVAGAAHVLASSPPQEILKDVTGAGQKIIDGVGAGVGGSASGNSIPQDLADLFDTLGEDVRSLSSDARAAWDEVLRSFPEALKARPFPPPKRATKKKSADFWDHIVKGSDVKRADGGLSVTGLGEEKKKHDKIDGDLDSYALRVRKADPSTLNIDPNVTQYSGYLDDEENDKHLFYWFFESRNDPKNDPVILWLNGGPGCSSMLGMLMELGPSWIDKKLKPNYNPYSWNSNASVIFLDQPVNTGFSYSSGGVYDTISAAKDVYALMTLFFSKFPEYADQAFHVAGESYGGHYVPAIASEILSHEKRNINLQSILIGNGLTDPVTQYEYYRPMACGEGVWPRVLDKPTCQSMDNALPRCLGMANACYRSDSLFTCVPASIYCNNALLGPYSRSGQNVYDVREKCKDPENLCYTETAWIQDYLNQDEVMSALGAEVDEFESCNTGVNRDFLLGGDWMKPFHLLVPGILDSIPVVVYAGDADFICNYMGNRAWLERLEWPGQEAYNAASLEDWTVTTGQGELIAGKVKSSGNLTFVTIHAAGHMAPHDQPEASLDFVNRWLGGEWLAQRK